jgi:hypothetical protein
LFFKKRDLDVGVFPPFFGQNLDANIVILVGSETAIITIYLAVQNDGRSPRRQWLARHLEFCGRDGLKPVRGLYGWRVIRDNAKNTYERAEKCH